MKILMNETAFFRCPDQKRSFGKGQKIFSSNSSQFDGQHKIYRNRHKDSRRQADHVNMDQQIQAMIYAEGRRPHNHCGPAGKQEGLYYLLSVFQFLPYGKAVEYAH